MRLRGFHAHAYKVDEASGAAEITLADFSASNSFLLILNELADAAKKDGFYDVRKLNDSKIVDNPSSY